MGQAATGLVGTVLDNRYLIEAPIAQGGMSTVFRGTDRRLGRAVAVKVMRAEFAADPAFLQRFEFEARSVAGLKDPGLVAVYDQGVDGGHAFLVMELIRGGTLRELLRERGPMPPHAAAAVARPALTALAAAHRAGLVHRDVKPENVLISDDGEVKLADFGLVRAVAGTSTTSGSVMLGTAAYLSPEQVSTGRADPRSDVYAMGVLLFEMLTGRTPFPADTNLAVAYRRIEEDVPAPGDLIAGVPPEFDELVLRATERDPHRRYRDGAEMGAALESVAARLQLPRFRVPAPRNSAQHRSMAAAPAAEAPTVAAAAAPPAPSADATAVFAPPGPEPDDAPQGPAMTRRYTTVLPPGPDAAPPPPGPAGDGPDEPPRGGYAPEAARARRRSRRSSLVWAAVVAVLAVLLGVGGWWFASGRLTTVPSISGMDKAAVLAAVSAADLAPRVRGVYSDDAPLDQVLGIDPTAGTRIARDSAVTVSVSLGRPSIPRFPSGTTADAAAAQLTERTLTVRRGADEYSATVPAGQVLRVAPAAGTVVPVGSEVTLTASKGPPPVHIPKIAGTTPEEATKALTDAHLTVAGQRTVFDAAVDGGTVSGTDPAVGAVVDAGTAVTLLVSNAVTVPDVAGKSPSDARAALAAAGLETVEGGTASGTDAPAGTVGRTAPAAGDRVDPAHPQVTVYVSDTSTVPNLVGRTVGTARSTLSELGLDVRVHQLFDGDGSVVIAQSPSSGTRLQPGRTVTLTAVP